MTQSQQSVLFLAIAAIWIPLLYIRTFDKTLKKYVALTGILLVFWMVVRMVKPYTEGELTKILWYLYYVPLLMIPTFYYNCSSYLLNKKKKKIRIATITISLALFILVITNNLHNIVFKLTDDIDDYTHNIGYFIIAIWILTLIIVAIRNLLKSSKEKNQKNIITIFTMIAIGAIYTILYVKNVPAVRHTNMSVIIGTLFCIGLELLFDFNLIPNNFKYKKIFNNSNLPVEIISNDAEKRLKTKHNIEVEKNIIRDIEKNDLKSSYKANSKLQDVKKIHGGYAIQEKDLSKINILKKKLQITNRELLKQEQFLKKQKKIETEIYEAKLKNEVIELLDETIDEKKSQITAMLDNMENIDLEKMQMIKLLINYCKRMSSLVISSYNKDKYNNKRLEIIVNELFIEAKSLNINGALQTNDFEMTSGETANVYETVFEIILNLKNTDFILNIQADDTYIEMKYLLDRKVEGLKEKINHLHLERISNVEEKIDDEETILKISLIRGEN